MTLNRPVDPVIDRLERKSLNNGRKEHYGVGSAQDDIVDILGQHSLCAHCMGNGQTSAQAAPGEQLDKIQPAVAVGDLSDEQRRNRQAAHSCNKVCRDRNKR